MDEPPDAATEDPRDSPNVQAMQRWEEVVADMGATAAEYREAGWDALQLHPGDVTLIPPDQPDDPGIDVLLPDDEFEQLQDRYGDSDGFDGIETYRAGGDAVVYFLCALEDASGEWAVLVPAYYEIGEDAEELFEHADEAGEIDLFLRRLSGDRVVVTHKDPDLVAPETGGNEQPESASDGDED